MMRKRVANIIDRGTQSLAAGAVWTFGLWATNITPQWQLALVLAAAGVVSIVVWAVVDPD
jgi:hypothetical protein